MISSVSIFMLQCRKGNNISSRGKYYMKLFNPTSGVWTYSIVPLQYCLAFGSLLWAIFLLAPGNTFERPVYAIMTRFWSEDIWGTLYLFHFIMLLPQVIRPNEFPCWAKLVVSALGCALWTSTHISMLIVPLPAAIAPGISLAVASWWILVRTPVRNARRKTDLP